MENNNNPQLSLGSEETIEGLAKQKISTPQFTSNF